MLPRGIKLYNSAIAASLGAMLKAGDYTKATQECLGEWVDIAGQYLSSTQFDHILHLAEDEHTSLDDIRAELRTAMDDYHDMAAGYAYNILGAIMGKSPSQSDIDEAIAASENIMRRMRETTEADRQRDTGTTMMIGYGYDFRDEREREADFFATR
jgi:hypothetical protein